MKVRTPRGGGIRRRVVRTTTVVTALAMAATVLLVALVLTELTAHRVDAELRGRIDTAAAALQLDDTGGPALANSQQADADDAVWLYDSDGTLVSGPTTDEDSGEVAADLADVRAAAAVTREDRRYLAERVTVPGHRDVEAVMVATASLRPYEQTRDVALWVLLGFGVVVVAGTAGLTAWTVGRTLRPVHRMTEQAADWSRNDLAARFDLGDGADEFTALGNTLDALLDRVATALRDEQRLTSELAHELRTPLTAIRAEAELGLLHHPDDARYARIVDLADRLSTTITTLLAAARDHAGESRRADVRAVVDDVLHARPRSGLEVRFEVGPEPCVAAVAPELLERIVAPILDNAFAHARSRIEIVATTAGARVVVRVSDDGAGVDAAVADSLFDAGIRHGPGDGAGLGLALARRLAAAVGGTITLASAPSPTTFEIDLPAR